MSVSISGEYFRQLREKAVDQSTLLAHKQSHMEDNLPDNTTESIANDRNRPVFVGLPKEKNGSQPDFDVDRAPWQDEPISS
jgi:hypothetical protein